jgi:hypothetical protein
VSDCAASCKRCKRHHHITYCFKVWLFGAVFDQAMEILEIQPDLQDVVLNADKKLSVQLRVRPLTLANCIYSI